MARRVHLVPKVRPGLRVQMARMVLMVRLAPLGHRDRWGMPVCLDRRDQQVPLVLKALKVR
jgi:hypothetical protein